LLVTSMSSIDRRRIVNFPKIVGIVGSLATLVVAASTATADSLQGTSGYGWQSWTTAVLNQNRSPYWDSGSWDGSQKNIGYCLTASGGCSQLGASPPGTIPYWGAASGVADPNMFFQASGSSNAAVQLTIAGNAGTNRFGWFETNAAGTLIGARHELFDGATNGTNATFSPTSYFGYYLTDGKSNTTWYSLSTGNPSGQTTQQHFAIFAPTGSSTFWIGMEDLPLSASDKDYNDLVIKVSAVAVPEPATILLVGSGIAGLLASARRWRR